MTSATKFNGIRYAMPFWDERFNAFSKEYQDIRTDTVDFTDRVIAQIEGHQGD